MQRRTEATTKRTMTLVGANTPTIVPDWLQVRNRVPVVVNFE
jgi:hypothetical protein